MYSKTENGYYNLDGDDSPFFSRIYETFFSDVPKIQIQNHDKVKFNHQQPPTLKREQEDSWLSQLPPHPAFIPETTSPRSCVRPTNDFLRVPGSQVKRHKPLSHDSRDQRPLETIPEPPMDASSVFRQVQGFGAYNPRPPQGPQQKKTVKVEDHGDNDGENSHRIAHTLTACCRCRQVSTCPASSSGRIFA
ncbi:uncharacterized protein F4822DRAFT_319354 [Hypoxylon trugodes]|uniref:uncharacterized protein n=1 Tax=Hypoxylon trugodes TaxID=326681 RepID=UPI002196758A|nr:uncharacterized protein F4822DRAFT_319354 [Hypoxylon trugodes]KAI1386529.1 hypothetical protein F4822DRAFT_319354 [Hypoxylon trugodes]